MRHDIDYYIDRNQEIVVNDRVRNGHFSRIDQMVELDYNLPKAMSDMKWMRKIVSTDPLSAITTGRRTLATVEPTVFLQPLNDKVITKRMANTTEQILLWQYKQAGKRAKKDITGDIVESALRYDMTAVQVIPLAWQLKSNMKSGAISKARYDAAKNYGDHMVLVENPKDVHPRWSPLGLESVLVTKVMRAKDVCRFYGELANELWEEIKDETQEMYVTLFDYWDWDARIVYVSSPRTGMSQAEPSEKKYVFIEEDMDLPFIPWSIEEGGTSLSNSEDHGFRPILGAVAHTNMWETQNIARSLAFAEAIAYSAAPRGIIYSYADDTIKIDYGDINKPIILKPGEEYKPLTPPAIDESLLHVFDRTGADIDKLTGIKNLANLDPPSGTAFATVNAVIKAATSALDPAKELAEATIAGVMALMLKWAAHTGEALIGFSNEEEQVGKRLERRAKHIEPSQIFINVELSAHVPTDRLQRINAASMLNKELNFSKTDAYRELDVANPEEIISRWQQEQFDDAEIMNRIKMINAETDLQIEEAQGQLQLALQEQARQMEMEAQQAAQAQAEKAQAQSQAGAQEAQQQMLEESGGRTGIPREQAQSAAAMGGQGFSPPQGGISPNEADPEGQLRENVTQEAKGGAPA